MRREEKLERRPLASEAERMNAPLDEQGLHEAGTADIARTLADRMLLLARREVELARAEAKADVKRSAWVGGLAGGTGVLLVAALVCGLVAVILAIGLAWNPIWVALIGFGLFLLLAAATGLMAASEGRDLKPERSIRQARQTAHFLREPLTT